MPTKLDSPPLPGTRAPPPGLVARPPPGTRVEPPPIAGTVAPPPEPAPDVAAKTGAALGSKRAAEIVTALLLLALGVLVLGAAIRMGIGWGSDGPESGFVPFWLAIALVLCSAWIIVKASRRGSGQAFATRAQLLSVLKVLLPATAMIAATPWLGLYVASALYTGVYMRVIGKHSWTLAILLPIAMMLLVFLVFERWFLVPLPKGPLETWLGY
jgi:putative tricarboxylic transport membrane protein